MRYMPPLWACTNTIFIYYLIFRGKMWFLFALFSRNVNVQTARNGIKLMDHHHVKTKQILENLQSFITKICEILCEAEIFEKKQCARAHTNSRKHKVSHRYFHWFFFFRLVFTDINYGFSLNENNKKMCIDINCYCSRIIICALARINTPQNCKYVCNKHGQCTY